MISYCLITKKSAELMDKWRLVGDRKFQVSLEITIRLSHKQGRLAWHKERESQWQMKINVAK